MSGQPAGRVTARRFFKNVLHVVSLVLTAPAGFVCWLESRVSPDSEVFFALFAQAVAPLPGYPGLALRRAYYAWTLESCSSDFFIGFGSLFTHRHVCVEQGVYIGNYSLIGCANLRQGCLIGSHTSLLSGPSLHEPDPVAGWLPFDPARLTRLEIGRQAWIGEHAVVMADLSPRVMVAAGSVVSTPVPHGIMVAGNPARFVRRVHAELHDEAASLVEHAR